MLMLCAKMVSDLRQTGREAPPVESLVRAQAATMPHNCCQRQLQAEERRNDSFGSTEETFRYSWQWQLQAEEHRRD